MRCCSQSPPASRKVRMPLSALMPAPVSTNTRIPRQIGIGEKATPGATRGSGIIPRHGCAPAAGGQDPPMFVQDLRRELSRRFYIRSRTARTAALRIAYVAYSSTLNGWHTRRPEPQAAASLRRRLEHLFDEDWQDADAGLYPRELIEALPWREYALAVPKLLADLPRTRERIRNRRHDELPEHLAPRYPAYYARNFHYQTDGYLGHTSAELYDLQVELLFGGTADAMRRRLIPPVVRFARANGHAEPGKSPARPFRVLDVACGTGHLLR